MALSGMTIKLNAVEKVRVKKCVIYIYHCIIIQVWSDASH